MMHEEEVTLVIADDHPVTLAGLLACVTPRFTVVGTAESYAELLGVIERARPQLVLTDLHMPRPEGMGLIDVFRAVHKVEGGGTLKVVLISGDGPLFLVDELLGVGLVHGFLQKEEASRAELNEMLYKVYTGHGRQSRPLAGMLPFTAHERELLSVIREAGLLPNGMLASHLQVSVNTVKYHMKRLYVKLGVSSRGEMVAKLRELQLI